MTALNFPANPTNGQTYENYVYDGTDGVWKRISPGGTLGNIDDVTIDSPADGESLVYDSATGDWINADATVEVYGVDTTATDYFMIPVGGDADRPVTPANGHIRFNSDSGEPEWYSEENSSWLLFRENPTAQIEYVLAAGGGGAYTGGGGAGGFLSDTVNLELASYTVQVGAGGPGGQVGGSNPSNGTGSSFGLFVTTGGGAGGRTDGGALKNGQDGGSGGGGGGDGTQSVGGQGIVGQGNAGGDAPYSSQPYASGGGGGAGGAGQTGPNVNSGGDGGTAAFSSITGSITSYSGGGGGAAILTGYTGGLGGGSSTLANKGGGGDASTTGNGSSGTSGTGGGGGGLAGYSGTSNSGGNGGSGVVILKFPETNNISIDPGLSSSTSTINGYKIVTFSSGTGTVTFS